MVYKQQSRQLRLDKADQFHRQPLSQGHCPRELFHQRSAECNGAYCLIPFIRSSLVALETQRITKRKSSYRIGIVRQQRLTKLNDFALLKATLKKVRQSLRLVLYDAFRVGYGTAREEPTVLGASFLVEVMLDSPKSCVSPGTKSASKLDPMSEPVPIYFLGLSEPS